MAAAKHPVVIIQDGNVEDGQAAPAGWAIASTNSARRINYAASERTISGAGRDGNRVTAGQNQRFIDGDAVSNSHSGNMQINWRYRLRFTHPAARDFQRR